jgi:hypothetical protein
MPHRPKSEAAMNVADAVPSPIVPGSLRELPEASGPVAGARGLAPAWARRLALRFACCYWLLYLFPFPLDYVPGLPVGEWVLAAWTVVVKWFGASVFGLEITYLPGGSGDTTFNYVQTACTFALALLGTAAWSALAARRTTDHARLHLWLRAYLRFGLGFVMISYGAAKVLPSQFPAPPLDRLLQPFGDASPMGLLWTFMGASAGYTAFSGAAEMLGGLLLVAWRTTLLGALVCAGVLSQIVALNFFYDVPVKLFSLHLLAMSLTLALPDLGRLWRFFVLNRRVDPTPVPRLFARPWAHRSAVVLRTAAMLGFALWSLHETRAALASAERSPLHGIWEVARFSRDGVEVPAHLDERDRWRRVVFDYPGVLAVQTVAGARRRYRLALDETAGTWELASRDDPEWKATLKYRRPAPDTLLVSGEIDGQRLEADLQRVAADEFLLTSRQFRWINEYPFNR